ncbi:type II toxin-antitoxin system PemK/MazF family toxin [Sphingomonas sp. 3-13AW]|uniref:type II toxin-antitoxin system PemK/MazF family toxin n=1 Tax=Sphingomonas sp. 3-13AW TaxID=3050450 RepID=UPI003BB658DC
MPSFEPGTIVRVPFPYTDRETRQRRPALVVASNVGPDGALLWVLMITSAANRRWPDDVAVEQGHEMCGLPAPSLVRTAKIATIETRVADALGRLDDNRMAEVLAVLVKQLGIVAR